MKITPCPKCGSADRKLGKVYPSGEQMDIRFKADDASVFSFKKHVSALACTGCGYIELFLAQSDT